MEKEQKAPPPYTPPYYEEDEIDLYELWLTLKKRKAVIFITTFIFVIFACVYLFVAKDIYKIKFALQAQEASVYEISQGIETISTLIKEGRYDELRKVLNIKNPKNIISISSRIPRNNKEIVEVTLESTNNQELLPLQKHIAIYLAKIPTIKNKIELRREILTKEIKNLERQIRNIEELKKEILKKSKLSDNEIKGITELELLLKDLQSSYLEKYSELQNLKPFFLITTNVAPTKPYKPKKKLILAVSIVSGLFLGMFLAFFLEWLENAKKRKSENP
ncbi:Wzz/FepE/Etk N-terminal domain-containing protein [Thermodesulfatator atlanticus]|uniref:Wzz/FepE/Etk N-terminal domain-containing protein n=1 Tax=Thermodesulfatator atlanticus TaxID=501497 RepID=UPI0003B5F0F7|nr:Wzz/FepE/Etk N-terminal domain-containing protein [Thermodesulfatator atlanticus]